MANCTKEYSKQLVEKFWEREWEKIKQIDFPKTREHEITEESCVKELSNLKNSYKSNKALSKTIVKFHESMKFASRKGRLSPYEFWQKLKTDPNLFKIFYENRLRCSDWFNEKQGANFHYLHEGYVPEFIYGIGLSTSRKAPMVSYFKPALAKNIILKYLDNFNTIFDPCSGYSGRMIGSLCSNKNFIGYDINDLTINESQKIYNFSKHLFKNNTCELYVKDSLSNYGNFECMLTCTPYKDLESWKSSTKIISSKLSCDDWIDRLINNYKCKRYIFVVDDTIEKYKNYIVEELENFSHFGINKEYIIKIDKD